MQLMNGAVSIAASLSFGSLIARVAMIPGIAQAWLERKGTNACPERPKGRRTRSMMSAPLARYPDASRSEMRKKRRQICGRKTTVAPTPATTPFAKKSWMMPSGIVAETSAPSVLKMFSIQSIGYAASEKTA